MRSADVADRPDAGDVGGAAQVLAARVDQQQAVTLQPRISVGQRAVMRQCAVGVVAGDGGETQTHKTGSFRAFRRELLIDREFADALTPRQRGLEPGVELAHRCAVLGHRLTDETGLGIALAALEQRARVDRLDHPNARSDLLAKTQRDAARVEQQRAARRQRSQRRCGPGVIGQCKTVSRELRSQGLGHLASADKQRRPGGVDQQMGQKHRVVINVSAAQIAQPSDVVDRRDEVMASALSGKRFAYPGQTLSAGLRRLRRVMGIDRSGGQRRTVRPDLVDQVDVGAQRNAGSLERAAQLLRGGQAQNLTVGRQGLAARQVLDQPLDVMGRRAGRDLDQRDPAAGQLRLGLLPVTAVGKQRCGVGGDHQGGHRTGESRQPLAGLPASRQVFRQVRIGAGHQQRVHAVPGHRATQARQALKHSLRCGSGTGWG